MNAQINSNLFEKSTTNCISVINEISSRSSDADCANSLQSTLQENGELISKVQRLETENTNKEEEIATLKGNKPECTKRQCGPICNADIDEISKEFQTVLQQKDEMTTKLMQSSADANQALKQKEAEIVTLKGEIEELKSKILF
jgi:tRNA U54 and U55 pseudouridine synthase Pus10